MASTGTAVPGNVNLSRQKPYAVSAYSRRVKSLANNAQSFGPDSYVNITLDTSTPGSFLDPLQSYLKFDLVFRNTNLFADYVSFGAAGAASLIEEFRIYVQGTPIEEILQYNVFYELAMNQNGQCQQPFQLFKPSTLSQGVSQIFNQSAIKSPMVDFDGRPMYGEVRHSDYHSTSSRGVSWAYPISQGTESQNPKFLGAKMIASQASVSTRICFSGCRPYFTGTNNAIYKQTIADPHALIFGQNIPTTTAAGVATGSAVVVGTTTSNSQFPTLNQSLTTVDQVTFPTMTSFTKATAGTFPNVVASQGACGLEQYNLKSTNSGDANVVSQFTNYLSQPSGFLPYAGSTVEIPSLFTGAIGGAGSVNPYVDPDFDPRNPLNWCSILPATDIRPEMKTLGPDNLQDYFMFLANTKNIPIGLAGRNKYSATDLATPDTPLAQQTFGSNNFRNFAEYKGTNNGKEFIYTCCIPLISGVLGSFAEKCWPTMLVAPGSMYIQIRTATAQKAFQLSMDPCRRVLGSIRDFLPFGGSIGGIFGQFSAPTDTTLPKGDLTDTSQFFNKFSTGAAIGSLEANPNGFLPMNTFTDYQAPSNFNTSATQITPVKAAPRIHTYLNGFSCIGASLFSANNYMTNSYIGVGNGLTKGAALMFRPYGVAAMEGRWTIGKAYVSQFTGATSTSFQQCTEEGNRILPLPLASGAYGSGTNTTPSITLGAINAAVTGQLGLPIKSAVPNPQLSSVGISGNDTLGGQGANPMLQGDVQVDFSPAGIPLPQYILHSTPWLRKEFFCSINASNQYIFCGRIQDEVASEASACYGTYLSASVPQCRRVYTNNQENGTTSYLLQNIEFVSQQIILPDSVAASILEDASQGDISITANSVHNYQTPIAQSTSQNLIIPAKIASANTMYCLFVPGAFVSGNEASLYNSLRGICPFGSVQALNGLNINGLMAPYDNNNVGLGYIGGNLEVVNVPCSAGQFQIQLKVGNELIPQQPLTTISELLTENVKAQHKLFDTRSNVNATMNLCTRARFIMGGAYTEGLSYDTVRGGNFTTTFVSAALTDDQTAINSPTMCYAYACDSNFRAQSNNPQAQKSLSDYVITRAPHSFELFQPPESTFVIAFDMDTWSRVSDVARSGKYLGNNTITLSLQNAIALGAQPQNSGSAGYTLQTFVVHDIRFSFQAGGSVVSYY